MKATVRRWCLGLVTLGAFIVWANLPVAGQVGAKSGEWTTYGGDLANTRYAPLAGTIHSAVPPALNRALIPGSQRLRHTGR